MREREQETERERERRETERERARERREREREREKRERREREEREEREKRGREKRERERHSCFAGRHAFDRGSFCLSFLWGLCLDVLWEDQVLQGRCFLRRLNLTDLEALVTALPSIDWASV